MNAKRGQPTLVVGVGASAGGLAAFRQLLSALPDDSGMAFLLVQHLSPNHKSLLPDLLAPCTDMAVLQADSESQIQANTVYVIRPDTALAVRDGNIQLSAPAQQGELRLSANHLFRSLAREYGPRAVGIVLSGAGNDGSAGLRDIKAVGGLTIAQKPETCEQPGMPTSAIDTGVVDLVLDIPDMPQALERFADLPSGALAPPDRAETDEHPSHLSEQELGRLAALLQSRLDFNLDVYKSGTIERRVLRRMALSGCEHLEAYLEQVRQDPREQQALMCDLLISVTDFFRDAEAFQALRELVIAPMVLKATTGTTLRVWVPACATGEEAYSIAMEFLDAVDAQDKQVSLQVFATDIDQEALAVARAGRYPPSIADQVPPQHLQAYFKALDGKGYQVRSPLRDIVSFAVHDLTKDPPFSRMNLVSCRNMLIYLRPETQQRVLEVLHFALRPGAYLFLGTAESIGPQRELFATVSKKWRIYQKVGASHLLSVTRSRALLSRGMDSGAAPAREPRRPPRLQLDRTTDLARRIILQARVAPSVIVSAHNAVLFMHGELRPYLRFPQGDNPQLELTSLITPELATRTRAALYKCRRDQQTVVVLSSPDGARAGRVRITATPAFELGDGAVLLTFEDIAEEPAELTAAPDSSGHKVVIAQLEKELQATREDLYHAVEELETSNEELRTSSEESMSMSEEFQAANEELEATTEELRSLNEELTTVNAQLREKVEQLERAHDDLDNFFSSTKIATLFLDEHLCIKRFTPAAAELLGIDEDDIGRHAGDIARDLLQNDLDHEARMVLEHQATQPRELRTQTDRWITRQVLPYRTGSRHIEGVVVTFVDVTALKATSERLAVSERQQAVIARLGLHALKEADLHRFLERTVREVQQTLNTDYCKILELQPGREKLLLRTGVGWREGLVGAAHVGTGLDSQAGFTLQSDEPVIVDVLATEKRFSGPPLLVEHGVVSGLSCVIRDGENPYGVIGAHTTQQRTFTREDANFLQAVASVAGSAVGRHQTRLRLAVERGVARTLAESAGLDEALIGVLECFARELRTAVGELWWPTGDRQRLSCRLLHVEPQHRKRAAEERFSRRTFVPGEGLVGRVFQQGRAEWVTDLNDPSLFARRDAARELGLVTGLGFPIRFGGVRLGAVTVFSRQRLIADDDFLGSLEALGSSIGDFLARTKAEEKAQRLAAITESSHDAILSYNFDGRITEWLVGAERLYGYTAGEMIGTSLERIIPEDRRQELHTINTRIRRGELIEPLETQRLCKDGRVAEVSVRSSPIKDRHGSVVGVSSTDRDMTRQKETERRLVAADRQKDEFLAMLGHELRNPLAAIRSAAELLKLSCGDAPRLQRTQAILERQSAHMAKLLDGLLDVSRIIRGKIKLETEVIDLAEACREVISDITERLAARELDIRADVASEPMWIEADRVRLAQVIDNLLSNAIKYTDDGGTITLMLTHDNGMAVLTVRDTGIGIEPELLPHIFDVFWQAKQSLDRSYGGLGLGLALVKSLVELHGGGIEARSQGPGRGSEFVVRLPITRKAAPRARKPALPGGALHILLIEDNEDSAEMLRAVLELSGHHVAVATRGRQGVAMARELEPDVLLCDIGLPEGMTGYDVARELRADPVTRDLRMVALTGYGRPEDKTRCADAGFDAHITKPVDAKTVERVLADLGAG